MNSNQYDSLTIRQLQEGAMQAGTQITTEDLEKTREVLLKEMHATARMPPFGPDGSSVVANTMAKYASLLVVLSRSADAQQRAMFRVTLVMVLLVLVQIGIAASYWR